MLLRAFAAAFVLVVPAAAHAQFAGVVTAPPRRAGVVPLSPSQARAQRDSVRREALSDMRAWVDSAAGVVIVAPKPPAPAGRDPVSRPDTTGRDTTRTAPAAPPGGNR